MTSEGVTLEFVSADAKRAFLEETGLVGREYEVLDTILHLPEEPDGLDAMLAGRARRAFVGMRQEPVTTQTMTPNSPSLNNWTLERIQSGASLVNFDGAGSWDYSYDNGAPNVDICVYDQGVLKSDPQFSGIQDQIKSLSVYDGYGGTYIGQSTFAPNGNHGTYILGTLIHPATGVAKAATYWGMRASAPLPEVFNAVYLFHRAKANGRPTVLLFEVVISGSDMDKPLVQALVDRIAYHGVIFVQPTGNNAADIDFQGPSDFSWNLLPGTAANLILVGGLTKDDRRIFNYGERVDFYAPAEDVLGTNGSGGFVGASGTSPAASTVAGAVARFINDNLQANVFEIKILMQGSGTFKDMAHAGAAGTARGCILQAPATIPLFSRPSGL